MSQAFARLQKVLPQHGLSRIAGRAANSQAPWLRSLLIKQFARLYKVDLTEAEQTNLDDFISFNDFFTRALKPGARPLSTHPQAIVSPADGTVSQLGPIEANQLLQAKGHSYTIQSLAGPLADGFDGGTFCTIYLAPSDYHRVHLPYDARLAQTLAVPGELFSVNHSTESAIAGLFARNERLVCRFESEAGPMLVILVGAMIVASIETVWPGPSSPYNAELLNRYDLPFKQGQEIGRFLLGSTVICCFPRGTVSLETGLKPGDVVRMGQTLGRRLSQ